MIVVLEVVKNICNVSVDLKGFCFYKLINGIKRYLVVDILGFFFFIYCIWVNVIDDVGLIEMLSLNIDYFKFKLVNILKIMIFLDYGYYLDYLREELEKIYL